MINFNSPGGTATIIVAAGSSQRMGFNKIFAELAGKPVLWHSVEAFQSIPTVREFVVVVSKDDIERTRRLVSNMHDTFTIVEGGANRAESVRRGVAAITRNCKFVVIHDGARPFVTRPLINRVMTAVMSRRDECRAAIPAVAVKDTVKIAQGGFVTSTPKRDELFAVQTPQIFCLQTYRELMGADDITDDSELFERAGLPVKIVEGDYRNIKITTPEDLLTAERFSEHGFH